MTPLDVVDALWGTGLHSLCAKTNGGPFEVVGLYQTPAELIDTADRLTDRNVWWGVHGMSDPPDKRGLADDVTSVVALCADIDWLDPVHKDAGLPDEATTRARLVRLDFELTPSIVVHSGHGLQLAWLLTDNVGPDVGAELQSALDAHLASLDLRNDRGDLASVLRVPGSVNFKADPVPVVIEHADLGRRYGPEYLRKRLPQGRRPRPSAGGTAGPRFTTRLDGIAARLEAAGRHQDLELLIALGKHHGAHHPYLDSADVLRVTRPDTTAGSSATIGFTAPGEMYMHSPSWPPFQPKHRYTLGDVLALATDAGVHQSETRDADADAGVQRPTPELDPAALFGILGEAVATLRPHSEACDAALLVTLAVEVGNYIGRGPHVIVESDRHGTSLFAALVGQSARARKGTAAGRIQALMRYVDTDDLWHNRSVASGFGSGEGVIAQLANDTRTDDRLLVDERELAGLLTVASRDGSILSSVIRNGWDGQPLRRRVKAETTLATDYHLSALGHITREELERKLTSTEIANGFGNRWLWVHAYRARRLPHGGDLDDDTLATLGRRLADAIKVTDRIGRVTMTDAARTRWEELYDLIADNERPGIVGALTNRAEPYVLRLALLYAVLDGGSRHIDHRHLEAAWALWRYCDDSVAHIWTDRTGDEDVDRLVAAVRRAGRDGLSLTDAYETVFAKHRAVAPIARRAELLRLVVIVREAGDGRPRDVLYAPGMEPR